MVMSPLRYYDDVIRYYDDVIRYYGDVIRYYGDVIRYYDTMVMSSDTTVMSSLRYYDDVIRYYGDVIRYYDDIIRYYGDVIRYYDDIIRYYGDVIRYYGPPPGWRSGPQSPDGGQGLSLLMEALTEVSAAAPPVVEPQIAMFCGHQLLHMNTETAQWEADLQRRQGCFTLPSQILSYCQEISHVEKSSSPATIQAWCKKGRGHCQTHPFIVLPYRCLVGEYVSEVLLVPDRCRFLHQEHMDSCESYVFWHNIAKEACSADSLELHSYGMLLPCEDRYRGVEYVCCPGRSTSFRGDPEGGDPLTPPGPGRTSPV
ncbi:hypothetical protein NHX12_001556 [Muraenolepis orangiensis]|uniref:E1 domain-containing protein n=1 Tax=Muraenolepis orangiensis TaxID=630683 RepID=A0A9Q0E011_9TELE|nr:hypothetical protein NHX12_001556 [Muraenolepis orangiensis]